MKLIPINIPKNMRGNIQTVRYSSHYVSTRYVNGENNNRTVCVTKVSTDFDCVNVSGLTENECNILLLSNGYLKQYIPKRGAIPEMNPSELGADGLAMLFDIQ